MRSGHPELPLSALVRIHGDDVRVIDHSLALLPEPMPADLVEPLLEALVDGHEYEEVLWSIVHAAESAHTGAYERGLLSALPRLSRAAPDWARALLLRCMNSETSLSPLLSALSDAPPVEREAVGCVAEILRRHRPEQFSAAANAIASAVG